MICRIVQCTESKAQELELKPPFKDCFPLKWCGPRLGCKEFCNDSHCRKPQTCRYNAQCTIAHTTYIIKLEVFLISDFIQMMLRKSSDLNVNWVKSLHISQL